MEYLRIGGAMGWRPNEVRDCNLGDFLAALDGWSTANGAGRDSLPEISDEELEADRKWLVAHHDWVHGD